MDTDRPSEFFATGPTTETAADAFHLAVHDRPPEVHARPSHTERGWPSSTVSRFDRPSRPLAKSASACVSCKPETCHRDLEKVFPKYRDSPLNRHSLPNRQLPGHGVLCRSYYFSGRAIGMTVWWTVTVIPSSTDQGPAGYREEAPMRQLGDVGQMPRAGRPRVPAAAGRWWRRSNKIRLSPGRRMRQQRLGSPVITGRGAHAHMLNDFGQMPRAVRPN